jgi:hypothetical protein
MKTLHFTLGTPNSFWGARASSSRRSGAKADRPQLLPSGQKHRTIHRLILFFVLVALTNAVPAIAQIQQAWVAHYNNGITNGTNQAVKMALDSTGNIYITGVSKNTNSQLGYVTIKYAPNGNQLWASRYDSTTYPTATPAAMVIDSNNNVIVTGSALTIKYDPNGNQLWTVPYAGTTLAVDMAGNSYVAGFGTSFNTVKLSPSGSYVWMTTYVDVGPTISQSVLVDSANNVYVSGLDSWQWEEDNNYYAAVLTTIKYGSNGSKIWQSSPEANDIQNYSVQVVGAALDKANNIFLLWNLTEELSYPYMTSKYSTNGSVVWTALNPTDDGFSQARGLALDNYGNVFVTGENAYDYPNTSYGSYKLNTNGGYVWTNLYPNVVTGSSVATSIAVDSANNSYVTGYSPGTNSLNDIVTIKYGPNGNQEWLQRYNGPGNGNDAGNAIAVDNNGNVYVAGYDTTTAAGTEMVLIKYSPLVLQKQANGSILLQAQGYAGENFNIQASEDLFHWLDLGSVTADTNGLMQFDDTNAVNYPARFYMTNPQ